MASISFAAMAVTSIAARILSHRLFPVAAIALALLLVSPSLWSGLQLDDYVQRAILSGAPALRELYPSRLDLFAFICPGGHSRMSGSPSGDH
jgi:hypothetical protein